MEKLEMLLMVARMVTYYIINYDDILAQNEHVEPHGGSIFMYIDFEDIDVSIRAIDYLIAEIEQQLLVVNNEGYKTYANNVLENLRHARNIQVGIDNGWDLDKVNDYINENLR